VTIVSSDRGHVDALDADVFSWSELPDLLAAEDLFSSPGWGVVARGDDEDDDEDDDFEDDDEELDDDEESDDEDEELEEDDEWEEVDDEEDE